MQDKNVENWVFFADMLSIDSSLEELSTLMNEACDLSKKTEEFHYLSGLLEARTLQENIPHQLKVTGDLVFTELLDKVKASVDYEELSFWLDTATFSAYSLYQLDQFFNAVTASFEGLKQKNDEEMFLELIESINFLAGFNDGLLISQQAKGCQKMLDNNKAA